MNRNLLIILIVAIAGSLANGQTTEAYIGTTALQLNSPQSAVLGELGQRYRLVEEDGLWQVWSKTGERSIIRGTVGFKNGRLSFVSSSAYVGVAGDPEFSHALYRVAKKFADNGENICALSAKLSADRDGEATFLICGERTIKITTVRVQTGREIISIDEEVGSR